MNSIHNVEFGPSGSASRFPISGITPDGDKLAEVVNRNLTAHSTAFASKAPGPKIKTSTHLVLPKINPDSKTILTQKSLWTKRPILTATTIAAASAAVIALAAYAGYKHLPPPPKPTATLSGLTTYGLITASSLIISSDALRYINSIWPRSVQKPPSSPQADSSCEYNPAPERKTLEFKHFYSVRITYGIAFVALSAIKRIAQTSAAFLSSSRALAAAEPPPSELTPGGRPIGFGFAGSQRYYQLGPDGKFYELNKRPDS
jgi:hypothetical protein